MKMLLKFVLVLVKELCGMMADSNFFLILTLGFIVEMTPFVKLPKESWPSLRNLYIPNWPKGAAAYCFLDAQINNPRLSEIFDFEVYCPFGEMKNGMIALSNKSGSIQLIILPLNTTAKMEEALVETSLIDWNENIMVPFAGPDVVDCLLRVSKKIHISVNYSDGKAFKHLLSNNTALFDISLPTDTYIASLRRDHLHTVDKTWAYHNEHSKEFFEILMENDMTYVLYSCDDEPMAWITVNEAGALTHLFCLDSFRRRGYAELVTKFACNDLLKKGRYVIAYTVEGNEKSQKLLNKLGFEDVGCDYWVFIKQR